MKNKKVRIVCMPVDVPWISNNGKEYTRVVWQEVYESPYRVDCEKWIATRKEQGDTTVYKIFMED